MSSCCLRSFLNLYDNFFFFPTSAGTGALPTAEGCSKVTVFEHSVLLLVSCCQSNNCVNYNKVYLMLVYQFWIISRVQSCT